MEEIEQLKKQNEELQRKLEALSKPQQGKDETGELSKEVEKELVEKYSKII